MLVDPGAKTFPFLVRVIQIPRSGVPTVFG